MGVALLLGGMLAPVSAQAQTNEVLQAQIVKLLQLVASLQAQLAAMNVDESQSPEDGFAPQNITEGSEVRTTMMLRARAGASTQANLVNTIAANVSGTIVDGPRYGNGYTWWLVNYSNGTQGWSAGNWLVKTIANNTRFDDVEMTVESYNNRIDTYLAEFDFADVTSYTYEIDWGEGDQTKQTNRSRVVTVCNSDISCSSSGGSLHIYEKSGTHTVTLYALLPSNGRNTARTVVAKKSVQVKTVSELAPTCTITTDKPSYSYGEPVEVSWTTTNTDYVVFKDLATRDSVNLPSNRQNEKGVVKVDADVIGRATIELTAYGDNDLTNSCSRIVTIAGPSVTLTANYSDTAQFELDPAGKVEVRYYPLGKINTCKLTASYEQGEISHEHEWNRTVRSAEADNYGRGSFLAVSSYSPYNVYGELEKVGVSCDVASGDDVHDRVLINVSDSGERRSYSVDYNGDEMTSGSSASERDVWLACRDIVNTIQYGSPAPQSGDKVDCYWGQELIYSVDGWKG